MTEPLQDYSKLSISSAAQWKDEERLYSTPSLMHCITYKLFFKNHYLHCLKGLVKKLLRNRGGVQYSFIF